MNGYYWTEGSAAKTTRQPDLFHTLHRKGIVVGTNVESKRFTDIVR